MDDASAKLLKQLEDLKLPKGSYAIFGSGPMAIRELKPFNDVDLVVTQELFDACAQKAEWKIKEGKTGVLYCGDVEMIVNWRPGQWSTAELIVQAEEIGGFPFVRLEEVLKWKKLRLEEKDLKDIETLEKYLAQN